MLKLFLLLLNCIITQPQILTQLNKNTEKF